MIRVHLAYVYLWSEQLPTLKMISHLSALLPPANEVWGKAIFLHQFVILFTGGVCVVAPGGGGAGGHVWLLWGGVCGCTGGVCMVAPGGAWFYSGGMHGFIRGACMVLFAWFYLGGHMWLHWGGMGGHGVGGVCGFIRGGMHGFIWGACVVFSVFSDTMRYGQ